MADKPIDVDVKQAVHDLFLTPNAYRLDDTFVIRDGQRHPFAVLCPGGGYQMVCSFIEGKPLARRLNEQGVSAFIVYYHVKKKARYPGPQEDLARAIREILNKKDEYCLNAEDYSVWGSSAGGHLAASFGTEHMGYPHYGLPRPLALVLAYPVITMEPTLTHMKSHDLLLGKAASRETEEFASVERHVTSDYPPTFLWCGDADQTVSPENTRRMAAALERSSVPVQCHIFPGVGHGVGPGTGTAAEGWIQKALEFWREQR